MYKISQYSKQKANMLGVKIKPSTRKNKKIDVYDKENNYITSIGDTRYKDYPTYINEEGVKYANKRRLLYKKRHDKYRNIVGSSSYYADKILW